MLRLALALLLAGCNNDPSVEILLPGDGTTITTTEPIVFQVRVENLSPYETNLYVDGSLAPFTELEGSCPHPGTGLISWRPSAIANGSHEIKLACVEDLSDYIDTVTLVFARP